MFFYFLNMKKVLLITECLEKGVGKHVLDLYNEFKTDKTVKIWVAYGKERADREFVNQIKSGDAIELKNLKRTIGFCDFKSFFEIKKLLKKIRPDVVHCHSSKAGFSGRIAAKLCKVNNIIYSPHAYFFLKYEKKSIKRKIFELAEILLSRLFTTKTVTTSRGEDAVFLNSKIDKENKRILIEHGLLVEEFSIERIREERNKYNVSDDEILIGAMARFENQKDPIGTFKIMKELIQKNSNVKCIFWGNGSYYDEIKKMNLESDNVILLPGETNTPELHLSIIDIYLTASLYEGLPYTLLTALAYGLPIAASCVEGNKDCVFENDNGILFEPQNYQEAVNKICNMINCESYKSMKKKSLKVFNERFSIDTMVKKYRSLYINEK